MIGKPNYEDMEEKIATLHGIIEKLKGENNIMRKTLEYIANGCDEITIDTDTFCGCTFLATKALVEVNK